MVLVLLGSFLVYVMAPESLRGLIDTYLAIGRRTIPGQPWQVATALVIERGFGSLLTIFGLWFAGAAVEQALGTRRFLVLFVASGLASNLTVALLSPFGPALTVSGVGDSVLGLIVALAVVYRDAGLRLFGALAMSARTLAIFAVGATVVLGLMAAWPLSCGALAASATAYFLSGGKGHWLGDFIGRWRQKVRRSRYQVLDGGRGARRKDYLN